MLGLGLGLSKGINLLSNLKLLTRNADWGFWVDKATGTSKGTNSPATNPIQDLVGNADGTLQGFGFIPTSGYVDVVAPNDKTVTGIQGDGVNDVILLPSNAPNPVGLQDFGFAFVFKTGATLPATSCIYSRGDVGDTTSQFSLYYASSGNVSLYIENQFIGLASGVILPNTFYFMKVTRKSGVLRCVINSVQTTSVANVLSLTSRLNSRLFARATSTGNDRFGNHILCYADYNNGDNIDAWEVDQNKAIAKIYGL